MISLLDLYIIDKSLVAVNIENRFIHKLRLTRGTFTVSLVLWVLVSMSLTTKRSHNFLLSKHDGTATQANLQVFITIFPGKNH